MSLVWIICLFVSTNYVVKLYQGNIVYATATMLPYSCECHPLQDWLRSHGSVRRLMQNVAKTCIIKINCNHDIQEKLFCHSFCTIRILKILEHKLKENKFKQGSNEDEQYWKLLMLEILIKMCINVSTLINVMLSAGLTL